MLIDPTAGDCPASCLLLAGACRRRRAKLYLEQCVDVVDV